jgi:hypothetical protein
MQDVELAIDPTVFSQSLDGNLASYNITVDPSWTPSSSYYIQIEFDCLVSDDFCTTIVSPHFTIASTSNSPSYFNVISPSKLQL